MDCWVGIYIKEDDKQAKAVAQSMMQGITQEISVTVQGNTSWICRKMIKIEDSLTKLVGSYYIERDKHEWRNGKYQLSISLKE